MSDEDDPAAAIAALRAKLAAGPPADRQDEQPVRYPKPIYNLAIDDPNERSIILIIQTGGDGIARGMIALPQWYELPEMWDGPHAVEYAVRLADDYAHNYGYHGIAIDIESSQLWDPSWGTLTVPGDFC